MVEGTVRSREEVILKMIRSTLAYVSVLLCAFVPGQLAAGGGHIVATGIPDSLFAIQGSAHEATNLQDIVSQAPDSSVILIEGHHFLVPAVYEEELCGNCENPETEVTATAGLIVSGTGKRIVGISPEESFIHTNSGYGILFQDCEDCAVESLTVTDGIRDPDPNATDAAIVVKRSHVRVAHNRITGNIGDPLVVRRTVVGVIGIAGREDSHIEIMGNEIVRNSWDGIALYRDSKAKIDDNLIDGVDLASGDDVGGGRGVGIGLTWNSRAALQGNLVRRYWKGIGIFVDAAGLVVQNVVEDVATWGISLWDADKGKPSGVMFGNMIFRTGACGVAVVRGSEDSTNAGLFMKNVLVQTGQNPKYDSGEPYCFQQALAIHKAPESFKVSDNLFFANREPGDKEGVRDIAEEEFLEVVAKYETQLRKSPVLSRSEFLKWLEAIKEE